MAIKLKREIHKLPFPLPKVAKSVELPTVPFEEVSHIPGQPAAIRFFDLHSNDDLVAMRDILKGRLSRKWMDDVSISRTDYHEWAGNITDASFLFAVLDARLTTREEINKVRGFVNIYSEREEKFRVKRMEKLGFFKPTEEKKYMLEISMASRPQKDGVQSGSGLMSSSVRQSCLQVRMLLSSLEFSEIEIFGFCDLGNIGSQRTMESAGFVRKGKMKYDADSEDESYVYILDWKLLQRKVKDRLMEILNGEVD